MNPELRGRPGAAAADNRRLRGEATRRALMRAAEKLFARHGIGNVTIRDILAEAKQKNTSALQYHFGSLKGLIRALRDARNDEVKARRSAMIAATLTEHPEPELRDLCRLMVAPVFELASADAGFRRYVSAFGYELAQAEDSALARINKVGGDSAAELGRLLRRALPHLDSAAYQRRIEDAIRFAATSMVHHAQAPGAFRDADAAVFLSSLIDALTGLLNAPESAETRSLRRTRSRVAGSG